jgi:osmotically-inducible protein OsmY
MYDLNVPAMRLTLSGRVEDDPERRALVMQFRTVGGVCEVIDEIAPGGAGR